MIDHVRTRIQQTGAICDRSRTTLCSSRICKMINAISFCITCAQSSPHGLSRVKLIQNSDPAPCVCGCAKCNLGRRTRCNECQDFSIIYIKTMLLFIDSNVILWSGLVWVHWGPGVGDLHGAQQWIRARSVEESYQMAVPVYIWLWVLEELKFWQPQPRLPLWRRWQVMIWCAAHITGCSIPAYSRVLYTIYFLYVGLGGEETVVAGTWHFSPFYMSTSVSSTSSPVCAK